MTNAANSESQNWRTGVALAAVLVIAAALRVIGLRWGLPDELHAYSYHPDEFLTVGAAFSAVYLGRSFDPRLYNYPSLYIYLSALSIAVGVGYGIVSGADGVYLAARSVTVIMGVGAVAATYWAGREMFGRTIGLLAALILAVAPLHVQHSHFATVDVPSTLFVALALGFCAKITKWAEWRDYVLAGIMVGLAAGTKYNAAVVVLSVVAAHFLRTGITWRAVISSKLWVSLGCVIVAFIASTPGSVLRTSEFLHGLTYEMKHASMGHGLVFAGTGNGFVYTFTSSLWYGLGPLLAILFVAAVVTGILRRDKMAIMMLAFVIPYYLLISLSQVRFARYTLPMYPAICILCAWLMLLVWNRFSGHKVARRIWVGLTGVSVLWALVFSAFLDSRFVVTDTRNDAANWIFHHVSEKSSIGLMDLPWFYSPPLSKNFGFGTVIQREEAVASTPYEIVVFSQYDEPGRWFNQNNGPKWIVISDYEVEDAIRLANYPGLTRPQREQVGRALVDLDLVEKHYRRKVTFGRALDQMGLGCLPHDMRYASPKITIYERKR